jgi:hypothetical protein
MSNALHIVDFSGGLCSFWAAMRVKERHGKENMALLFADTLIEDGDLYEFNEQAAAIIGVPITRVSVGLTPWELFRKEGLIGNNRFPICSVRLKREPLNAWHAANAKDTIEQLQGAFWDDGRPAGVIYIGFDWTEENRLADLRRELPTWRIEAPMTEPPYWDKCRMQREAAQLGLKISRLYELGFPHNNCGGRCVRSGITQFVHLYHVLRPRFIEWRDEEAATVTEFRRRGIEPFSILKDRRGGTVKPLYLADLQARIESGEKFPTDEWGGCGCGGATEAMEARDMGWNL